MLCLIIYNKVINVFLLHFVQNYKKEQTEKITDGIFNQFESCKV